MQNIKITKFLKKLFIILDSQGYNQIISWDSSGTNIIIHDQQKLQQQIIPLNFSLKKFSSFIRQLHLYDFHKIKSRFNQLIFNNIHFQRQNRQLASLIVRKRKLKSHYNIQEDLKKSQKTIHSPQIYLGDRQKDIEINRNNKYNIKNNNVNNNIQANTNINTNNSNSNSNTNTNTNKNLDKIINNDIILQSYSEIQQNMGNNLQYYFDDIFDVV